MTPIQNIETAHVREVADQVGNQNLIDVLMNRVQLPGFYLAPAARLVSAEAPDEFAAEQIGFDGRGQAVYVLYWLPPRAQLNNEN